MVCRRAGPSGLTRMHQSTGAAPDVIQFAPGLPKTRSGKIMENEFGALGDTSTLAYPAVVEDLIKNR